MCHCNKIPTRNDLKEGKLGSWFRMSPFIVAEKLWHSRAVCAVHTMADQEAKSTPGTRACSNLQRPAPADPFPPTRLHPSKVPQSPRITPLAEERVCDTFPGMQGQFGYFRFKSSRRVSSWVALTVDLTAWSHLGGRPQLRNCVDQTDLWPRLVVMVMVGDCLDCHLMK